MNFNRELHAASIVEDIYSTGVIKKCNMIPIHVSNREPTKSTEVENDYKITGKYNYIISSYLPLKKNHNIPYSPTSVIILLTT